MYQYAPDLLESLAYALQLEAGDCGEIGLSSHPGTVYYASDKIFYQRRINGEAFSAMLTIDARDVAGLLGWLQKQGERWVDVLVGYDSLIFLGDSDARTVSIHPLFYEHPFVVKRMFVGYVDPDVMRRIWEMTRSNTDVIVLATTDQDVVASVHGESGGTDWYKVGYTPYKLDWCFEIPAMPLPPHTERWWQVNTLYATGWPMLEFANDEFDLAISQAIVTDCPWRRWRIGGTSRVGVCVQTNTPELLGDVSWFYGNCYSIPLRNIVDLSHLEAVMESTMAQYIVPRARQRGYEIPASVTLGWDDGIVVLKHPHSTPEIENEIIGALDAWIRYLAEQWVAERLGHPCFA